MFLLPLDLVSKNQLSTNQNLFNARANSRNDSWTCIALRGVLMLMKNQRFNFSFELNLLVQEKNRVPNLLQHVLIATSNWLSSGAVASIVWQCLGFFKKNLEIYALI